MSSGPLKSIAIVGDGLRAALTAAYLAKFMQGSQCAVTVITSGASDHDNEVCLRPSVRKLHNALGVDSEALVSSVGGWNLFAERVSLPADQGEADPVFLPYGAYGVPHDGVAFHQYWRRARDLGLEKRLEDYNLALRMAQSGHRHPAGKRLMAGSLTHGYCVPRRLYCTALQKLAERFGTKFSTSRLREIDHHAGEPINLICEGMRKEADIVIDATETLHIMEQANAIGEGTTAQVYQLPISTEATLSGVEAYQLQAAIERFVELMPNRSYNLAERREYDRLTHAEAEHIEDMNALSVGAPPNARSARLQRKIQVFAECGRVPSEDYEVFYESEWIAILSKTVGLSRTYDRLADRLSNSALLDWMVSLGREIDKVFDQGTAAL